MYSKKNSDDILSDISVPGGYSDKPDIKEGNKNFIIYATVFLIIIPGSLFIVSLFL